MRLTFEERNTNTYTKYGDVSIETINKYEGILPDELLSIWQTMGYGVYEDGFLQLVNPDEYEFVFDYIDKLLDPSIVFGITALGDLLIWEGNNNKTIASDEGNRVKIINIRRCKSCALDNFRGAIDLFLIIISLLRRNILILRRIWMLKTNCPNYNTDNAMVTFLH